MDQKEERLLKAVDSLTDNILDLTSSLVTEPSTLGNEVSVIEVMEEELTGLGFTPERIPIDPDVLSKHPGFAPAPWDYTGRENLAAVRPADGQGGRSALFNGHLDVVSAEPLHLWDRDPFEPFVKDGWLYGRGAGDMKAGVAAMTYAVHAVEKAGFGLKAPVTINAVIEEECGGNGALATVAAGYDADAVLIPEPFGPTINTTQVGVLWFKITVRGTPTHAGTAQAGANAVEKCFAVISSLRELEAELNETDVPEAFRGIPHPINLNIGIFNGGDWPSTVPAQAEFHGRLGYFPGATFEQTAQKVLQAVERAAQKDPWLSQMPPEVDFYAFRSDGHRISRELPALALLNDCHKALTGSDAKEYISTCTTDMRAFHFFGQGQTACFGPVAENYHAANERVNIDSVIHTARTYALFLARWCELAD